MAVTLALTVGEYSCFPDDANGLANVEVAKQRAVGTMVEKCMTISDQQKCEDWGN